MHLRYVTHRCFELTLYRICLHKMALLACLAVALRKGGPTTVTAFSLVTTFGNSRVAASRAFNSVPPRALFNKQFRTKATSTITALRQSSLATVSELEKSLDVTHPAFEVIKKDVVTEYGAYCTLYRHKKSGAELLSVAVDDDNKVIAWTCISAF